MKNEIHIGKKCKELNILLASGIIYFFVGFITVLLILSELGLSFFNIFNHIHTMMVAVLLICCIFKSGMDLEHYFHAENNDFKKGKGNYPKDLD